MGAGLPSGTPLAEHLGKAARPSSICTVNASDEFDQMLQGAEAILALAPMQDVTDWPFWKLMAAYGGADIYSFGMSSISQADGIYWQNLKDLPAYYAAVDGGRLPFARGYILTDDDKIRRQTLRIEFGIPV